MNPLPVKPSDRIAITTNEIHAAFEEAVRIGVSWGIRNYEFKNMWGRSSRIPRVTPEQEKIIYDTFEGNDLTCAALSPGVFMKPYSKEQYAEDIGILEKTFGMARRLKTKLIVVFSFGRGDAPPNAVIPSDQVQALREAARRAAEQGFVLAVENMHGQWADTAENTRKVMELVAHPAYRLNWDPANAVCAGDNAVFPKGYEAVKPYMVHFHLKNILHTDNKPNFSVIPQGEIDYSSHISKVVADGYGGWFVIETHHEPLIANSKTNLDFLKPLLSRIEEKSCPSPEPVGRSGAAKV